MAASIFSSVRGASITSETPARIADLKRLAVTSGATIIVINAGS